MLSSRLPTCIPTWWITVILIGGNSEYPQFEPHVGINIAQAYQNKYFVSGNMLWKIWDGRKEKIFILWKNFMCGVYGVLSEFGKEDISKILFFPKGHKIVLLDTKNKGRKGYRKPDFIFTWPQVLGSPVYICGFSKEFFQVPTRQKSRGERPFSDMDKNGEGLAWAWLWSWYSMKLREGG